METICEIISHNMPIFSNKINFFLLCYVFKVSKEYAGTFGSLFEIARRCKVCKEGRLMECHEVAA